MLTELRAMWSLRTAALVVAAMVAATLSAQDEGKAVAALGKAFKEARAPKDAQLEVGAVAASALPPDRGDERRAALAGLAGFDSARVAAAIADAQRVLLAEAAVVETARTAVNAELEQILVGQLDREDRSIPVEHDRRYDELRELQRTMVQRGEVAQALAEALAARLGELRSPDALRHLLDRLLPDRRQPLPIRLAAARALAAGGAAVVDDVAAALKRSRDVDEQLALIDALVLAGEPALPHAAVLVPLLQSGSEVVRERAATALAKLPLAAAIEPMVALLQRSSGMSAVRVARALEVLTRRPLGVGKAAWREWWRQEGEAFVAGAPQLGGGTPSPAPENGPNYFGIPQDGKAILYCIDCSGSMDEPVEWVGRTASAGRPGATRLDACKQELVRALQQLGSEQQFAIVWYNDLPHWWQPRMLVATPANVAAAVAFVRGLRPAAMTNIHDALELGFSLAGRGARDRYYGLGLDTVFLLTDGTPTLPDGRADSSERILAAVRGWNPLGRVAIHTIGIGLGLDEDFLADLAKQNGGEFKRL